ncbi:MAG: metallopeptidase [Pirellulaceae bacterium]
MMIPSRATVFSILVLVLVTPSLLAEEKEKPVYIPTGDYDVVEIEGWTVYVDQRLKQAQPDLATRAERLVKIQLYQISLVVPQEQLKRLREVPIWICDRKDGPIHYHPKRKWLVENGYNPDKTKAVDISRAINIVRCYRDQPWVMMHELAHAYHDRVLSFEEPRVLAAYENAVKQKKYESVQRIGGQSVRHYALTNHKEYFAECTEAFLGTNDFYPFVRAELRDHDPHMFRLLQEIWGKGKK